MPTFQYAAFDKQGKKIQGHQDAPSEAALVSLLQSQNLIVTKVSQGIAEDPDRPLKKRGRRHRRVKLEDLLFLVRETATLLDVGVPFMRAIELISGQMKSELLSQAMEKVKADIAGGSTFQSAVAKHPKVFPVLWPFLIEAGETSGNLPKVLNQMADYLEASITLRKKVVSALVYPAVLIAVALGAVLLFMLKIIPIFAKLYDNFHAKLPTLTLMVVGLSNFLRHYFLFLTFALGVGLYFLRMYAQTSNGRGLLDRLSLKIPIFGQFLRDSILARISMHLSTLLKSGINLMQSMEITGRAAGNVVYEEILKQVTRDVQEGKALSTALEKNALFSSTMVHLIMIGEESGRLAQMIDKVSESYQSRVDTFVARLGTLIEPAILLFVGGVVGVLVIAMFLPIFRLGSVIH